MWSVSVPFPLWSELGRHPFLSLPLTAQSKWATLPITFSLQNARNPHKDANHSHTCTHTTHAHHTRTLTFNPELLDVGFDGGCFESDAAEGEQQDPDEEHLPAVFLREAAEVVEVRLEARPHP